MKITEKYCNIIFFKLPYEALYKDEKINCI